VLGQQVSVTGARTLAGRLAERFGTALKVPVASLGRLFPRSSRIAGATTREIGQLGITGRRAETLIALAGAVSRGELHLEPGNRLEGTLRQLRNIPGVGEWTAQYIAMRALAWPDAFPHTDLGLRKALDERNPKKILEMTEQFRPWRAYVALHLWSSLEKKS
jgi:AraC family transcriptional regulator of adaptative response / DNA-3-methyladenine glycosylase II